MASARRQVPVHFCDEVGREGGLHRAQQISERLNSALRDWKEPTCWPAGAETSDENQSLT